MVWLLLQLKHPRTVSQQKLRQQVVVQVNLNNLCHNKRNLGLNHELKIQLHNKGYNLKSQLLKSQYPKSQNNKSPKTMRHYPKLRLNQNLFLGQRKIENKLNIPQLVDMLIMT